MQLLSHASELGRVTGVAVLEKRSYGLTGRWTWRLLEQALAKRKAALMVQALVKEVAPAAESIRSMEHISPFSFSNSFPTGFGRLKPGVSGSWPDKVGPRFKLFGGPKP